VQNADRESNTQEQFYDDLCCVTEYRTDPGSSETLITRSLGAMIWLRGQGVRFVLNYAAQSAIVAGKRGFFGRMPLEVSGGGPGLVQSLTDAAVGKGIGIFYEPRRYR
jgi:tricarballylate dehydrogenase